MNKYFSSTISSESQQSFFVTLVNSKDRKQFYGNKSGYKKRLDELVNDDMNALEQLQYDRRFGFMDYVLFLHSSSSIPFHILIPSLFYRYANTIGALSLRRQVMELTWSKYQANIPELLKRLRAYKKRSEENLQRIQQSIKSLDR